MRNAGFRGSPLCRCARRRTGVKIACGAARDVFRSLVRLRPCGSLTLGTGLVKGPFIVASGTRVSFSVRPGSRGRCQLAGCCPAPARDMETPAPTPANASAASAGRADPKRPRTVYGTFDEISYRRKERADDLAAWHEMLLDRFTGTPRTNCLIGSSPALHSPGRNSTSCARGSQSAAVTFPRPPRSCPRDSG